MVTGGCASSNQHPSSNVSKQNQSRRLLNDDATKQLIWPMSRHLSSSRGLSGSSEDSVVLCHDWIGVKPAYVSYSV